jgi:hypothetical protein
MFGHADVGMVHGLGYPPDVIALSQQGHPKGMPGGVLQLDLSAYDTPAGAVKDISQVVIEYRRPYRLTN